MNKLPALVLIHQATNEGCSAIWAEIPMCDKCVEFDGQIERYRRLLSMVTDQQTIDGVKALIERMETQKAVLHPEQKE
jgi:hypothetical protein